MKKLLLAIAAAAPVPAQAEVVRIDIVGALYQVSDSVASRFAIGDAVTARLVIDTFAPVTPAGPGVYRFDGAVLAGTLTVDGYTAVLSQAASTFVTDDEFGFLDRLIVQDTDAMAMPVNGLAFRDLFFNWQDNSGTATPGPFLPTTNAALAAYGLPTGAIDWLTDDGQNRVTFAASSATLVFALPEPSTWATLIMGVGAVGAAVRRRRVQVSFG